jgi:putative spermidine/putrescine transport system permease protein
VSSFWNSLWLALAAATISTAGHSGGHGAGALSASLVRALQGLFLSPLIIPHLVLGVALLRLFSVARRQLRLAGAGAFAGGDALYDAPDHGRAHRLRPQRRAGRPVAGRPRTTVFLRITLPMILPGITGGWLLAFINSFDEVTMSIFVTSPSTVTLPVRMYMYATESIDPMMAAVSALMVGITAVADDHPGPGLWPGPRTGGAFMNHPCSCTGPAGAAGRRRSRCGQLHPGRPPVTALEGDTC